MSFIETNVLDKAPHMRLLRCDVCGSLDELPDWKDGPESDPYLPRMVEKHTNHTGQLFRLPIGLWLDEPTKQNIIRQVRGAQSKGLAEVSEGFYDVRNQFQEDAFSCFTAHQRPQSGCSSFNSPSKILKPDTAAERKEAGLNTKQLPVIHLCSFCPVRVYYERKSRGE